MDSRKTLRAIHLMRTYGAHGGENQLAAYFTAGKGGTPIDERFAFVYHDPECRALFRSRGISLPMDDLWPHARKPGTAWHEIGRLMPVLPVLQWRFFRLWRKARPDVCVVHGIQAALVAWPIAILTRKTTGFLYVHRVTKSNAGGGLARLLYRPFGFLAGNSRAVAQSLSGLAEADRVIALENGADIDGLRERAADEPQDIGAVCKPVLICVGRLLTHKRQSIAVNALAQLVAHGHDTELWIVGDGDEREVLEAQAKALGLSGRIRFLGHRADVPALLSRATIFVNTSGWEGMSNAVLEAMALGLPSVVADAPGVSECHIDGETGLIVDGTPEAFADAIGSLLDDVERARALGEAARNRAESHYSIKAARQRYIDAYRLLADQKEGGAA